MTELRDNPGVRIPPPFFYAAAIVIGLLLDGMHSLPMRAVGSGLVVGSGFSRIAVMVAWLLVAAWFYLTISSFQSFWRRHTSVVPIRPATTLVVAGPYRFTRNPMYLALALLTVALAIFLNTWWVVILLAPTLLAVQTFVIAREESYLHRRFGAEYDAYTHQVRRWL
jgi:protein-S-isoprenylcysteine O-methyltransferase Ste14